MRERGDATYLLPKILNTEELDSATRYRRKMAAFSRKAKEKKNSTHGNTD